jgi:hypothetical protein
MVRPNISVGTTQVAEHKPVDLLQKFLNEETFRTKVLQETANRWAKDYKFNGDLSFCKVSETGKSIYLAVDGKQTTSKYVLLGSVKSPKLISGKAIYMANRNK